MIAVFHEAAQTELDQAIKYYQAISVALSADFIAEAEGGVARIAERPNAWHPMGDGVRRYRLSRFPYAIIYRVKNDVIEVYAIMHLRRRPEYWRQRISIS